MVGHKTSPRAAAGAALSVFAVPAIISIAPSYAAPAPDFCTPVGSDDACSARLTSVTANTIDGTITGTPVDGGAPLTLSGQADAYLKSAGFGDTPPDAVQRWDSAIDGVNNTTIDPFDPNWYGNAKARTFLPRTLDDLATRFPPGTLVVRFVSDDTHPGWFRLVSIQPIAH